MSKAIQAVRGMNDLLPDVAADWHRVESVLRQTGWSYGYEEIRTPILEKTELFTQSIGDNTDIVEKEMYTFTDSGEESLSMRPEATASTVRACIQHGLLHNKQQRLWYLGPMFRRERPQKGRYRQFHQFGIEAFGWSGPDMDAEIIQVGNRIMNRLGLAEIRLELNTLGSPETRLAYRDALLDYFQGYREDLDEDSLRRLQKNPLRILDSKVARTQELVAGAPEILSFLDASGRDHFDGLCELLDRSGIEFTVNARLVRGLDYYTSTVFEWTTDRLGAQSAVCAGGRYDGLVEQRGARSTPAIGFAMGIERMVELVRMNAAEEHESRVDAYVTTAAETLHIEASRISEKLRDAGVIVVTHCGGGKLKNQMKRADQSGARVAIILGLDESGADHVQIKYLREQRPQEHVASDDLVGWCQSNL